MNARQIKKHLKKQINKLESDNNLMRQIIADSPKMQELYDVCSRPLYATHTTLSLQEFRAKRIVPDYMADVDGIIERTKQALAKDLFDGIKEHITYKVNTDYISTSITASIFIGRK